jgi:ketoreductase RED2
MSPRLSGRVALVTGSSSGIGEATARRLAVEGATVVVNSVSSVQAGTAIAEEIGGTYVQANVADEQAAAALVEEAVSIHGRLDILVNNAGTTVKIPHSDLASVTRQVWDKILDLNVIGTWNVSVAAVPYLRAAAETTDGSVIVNVSSVAGVRPLGSSIPYGVSKAAVNQMTRMLANTLGPEIRVNAVAPGFVETPWTADWELERSFSNTMTPLKSTSKPDDIAEVILGLIHSKMVTGNVVVIDAGLQLR